MKSNKQKKEKEINRSVRPSTHPSVLA